MLPSPQPQPQPPVSTVFVTSFATVLSARFASTQAMFSVMVGSQLCLTGFDLAVGDKRHVTSDTFTVSRRKFDDIFARRRINRAKELVLSSRRAKPRLSLTAPSNAGRNQPARRRSERGRNVGAERRRRRR